MLYGAKDFQRFVNGGSGAARSALALIRNHQPNSTAENALALPRIVPSVPRRSYDDDGNYIELLPLKPLSIKEAKIYLSRVKDMIVNRQREANSETVNYELNVGKFYRPWDVVPKLRDFLPPAGDFGVGVEVEYGFITHEDAVTIARTVKNWKHITMDFEGGTHGIETTFPPQLFSKLRSDSPCFKYLKLLSANRGRVRTHATTQQVGTHVNVSANTPFNGTRLQGVNNHITYHLSLEQQTKYFGRRPYGTGNLQKGSHLLEWKLFNSVMDWKVLRRYIYIGVSLAKLIKNEGVAITAESINEALENGYNLNV